MLNITYFGPEISSPQYNEQPFKCPMSTTVGMKMKMQNFEIFLVSNKASIFVCRDKKYHTRSCRDHRTVIINIGQPFEFAVSNSAPI